MHECYHEMGHWIEDARPDIQIRLKDFLEERTKGEKVLSLHDVNADYAKTEKYKKDKFIDPYFGKIYDTKDYKSNKTEILSTFFTYLHKNPNALMLGDPELFDFVFDILRGL